MRLMGGLIQIFRSEPRLSRYGEETVTYALAGRGLTAFLTKATNWNKLSVVEYKNKDLFDTKYRFGSAFSDIEFETLRRLGNALAHVDMLQEVLRHTHARFWREYYFIQRWRGSPAIARGMQDMKGLTKPSEEFIESILEIASKDRVNSFLNIGQDNHHNLMRRLQKLLDEMRVDDNFVFAAGNRLTTLLEANQQYADTIQFMLKHVPIDEWPLADTKGNTT